MKTINSILVVLIAAILTACSSGVKSDASADLFSIPTDKATVCQLTDIATDIEVVPLTHNEPIGILMQSRVYADKMILYESTDNNSSLLICNRKGEVLKRFSRKGRGPGEYQWISDFIYMPENDWLVVYDRNLYKCFIYTLADFKFLKQIELKQEATETSMHEEGIRSMCQLSEKELLLSVETQTGYLDEKSGEPVFEMKYTLSVLNVESGERRNIEYDEKLGAMGCITRIGDEIVAVASQNNNRLHTLVSISDKGSVEELMQFDYGVMTRPEGPGR
ncbi:MAG: 6-bladed beta-propeller [Alistipes sp.]|nr:6-bladed beta-propeller [Alistipes sp.]